VEIENMPNQIELLGKKVNYVLRISQRATRSRLAMYCDGSLVVTVPEKMRAGIFGKMLAIETEEARKVAEKFLVQKAKWVLDKLDYFRGQNFDLKEFNPENSNSNIFKTKIKPQTKKQRHAEFLVHKNLAQKLAETKIAKFNQFYNFKFNKITIKNQKTRWGSCSRKGNLNFNYKIALLPERLADYIIVHEICHLGEFNHSRKFWNLVAQTIPDYSEIRNELKRSELRFH
jgi:predicted metal-dependent hydrolase